MKFLLLQSLAIPVIQLLFDLIIRSVWISKGGSKWDAGVFLLGLLACWALSFTFLSVVSMLRRWNKWAMLFATSLFALWHTLVLTTNFFLFHFFGEYLFPGAFAFIFDKDYMLDYIRTFSGIVPIMSLLGLWGFFFLCVRPWKKSEVRYALLVPMTVVILAAGIVALHANDKKSEFRMPPDMVAVESLSKHFLRVRDHALPLYPSKRLPVWSFPGTTPPHTVLIIVHESMGTRSLPFMEGYLSHGSPEGGMPRLTQRMQQDSAGFIIFQRAYTNAVSTMVSMPSIFSGVSPEESYDKLHCMPLLWDMAKDAGYKTAYFSSQRLRWATMNDFLRKEPIDSLVGREQTDYPPVNDMGIDDFHIVTTLETWLAAHPKDPLFVVWNTNALHVPHQASSEYIDLSKIPGTRYEKALYLLDSADERVFRALENAGRMDEALIVSTADHGENPEPPHPIARIKSYYEEFIRIPLWVHLPRSMRGGVEEQAM
ncbi:MAG TPA: hypothetical protein DCQ83_00220, partial [Fibrobacteres bacterium]|nr:hypothetical protein [Fibrobacterota bacterium]